MNHAKLRVYRDVYKEASIAYFWWAHPAGSQAKNRVNCKSLAEETGVIKKSKKRTVKCERGYLFLHIYCTTTVE